MDRTARGGTVSLAEFFADPNRRGFADVRLGEQWRSRGDLGAVYHLYWLTSTGECYLMRTIPEAPDSDGPLSSYRNPLVDLVFAAAWLLFERPHRKAAEQLVRQAMSIEVLVAGLTLDEVSSRITGWEQAMVNEDGVQWLRSRFTGASSRSLDAYRRMEAPPQHDVPSGDPRLRFVVTVRPPSLVLVSAAGVRLRVFPAESSEAADRLAETLRSQLASSVDLATFLDGLGLATRHVRDLSLIHI